ncbi:MAG: hypothetical protein Q4A62_07345 [Eikenella sp.]|nr:hypothetical protein [Eikenella sp.]
MRFVFLLVAALAAASVPAQTPAAVSVPVPVSAQCLARLDEAAHLMTAGEVCESGELAQAYRAAGLVRMHAMRQQCGQMNEHHPQWQAQWRRHPAFVLDDPARRTEADIHAYCQAHRGTAAAIFRRYAPTLQQDIREMWRQAWQEGG